MKTQTISISVGFSRDHVFQWVSSRANLPFWLHRFCRSIQNAGAYDRAQSAAGEVFLALKSDAATGIVDLLVGAQLDEMSIIPLRVLSRPHGAAVVLTYFQESGVPGEVYRNAFSSLVEDMRLLMRRLGGGEMHVDGEAAPAFFPSLVTAKFYETWDFYTSLLKFRTVDECDVYVHLIHESGAQLGILKEETDGAPAELISSVEGRGFWLSLHVANADTEYERLEAERADIVEGLCNRPWGLREFTVRDPNGVLIKVGHIIPAFVEEDTLLAT
ncbi:MAG TPA: VOC family protein [Opitutaceae bacterium]|nr:VOC family protein [Opitutaceae bacterium]